VQLFEHFFGVQFRAVPAGSRFQMKKFIHISSSNFLCLLASQPTSTPDGLKVSTTDSEMYLELKSKATSIKKLHKSLAGKKKGAEEVDVDLGGSDEDDI
jgi:hypothetical protein